MKGVFSESRKKIKNKTGKMKYLPSKGGIYEEKS